MSTPMLVDSPFRPADRRPSPYPAHSLVPGPGRDAPAAGPEPTGQQTDQLADQPARWSDDDSWDDEDLYAPADLPAPIGHTVNSAPEPVRQPAPNPAAQPAPQPFPAAGAAAPAPASGARPAHCSVPPRRSVALFPTIRAGGGRHRLPSPVRRRPGPIAAGLMVAATTLAAGSLRLAAPPATPAAASTAHQCGPVRPGESCG